jgi:leucyl aminopeptidase
MKLIPLVAAWCSTSAIVWAIPPPNQAPLDETAVADRYLIELGPGETRWIEEDEKWDLRRVSARRHTSLNLYWMWPFDE